MGAMTMPMDEDMAKASMALSDIYIYVKLTKKLQLPNNFCIAGFEHSGAKRTSSLKLLLVPQKA